MALDDLIAQITNPQEFTRLCNSVFIDIYGQDFQVIDGTRGDNGNDGYVTCERRILAIYCPVKPEQKTDANYLVKITRDLAKAAVLKRSKRYNIDSWTFVTPRKLADSVIAEMRGLGDKVGICTSHQESTFLANELYRRPHLLKGFPSLHVIDLGAKIDKLAQMFATKREHTVEPSQEPSQRSVVNDEVGEARLHQLIAEMPSAPAQSALKALAYGTADPILEINTILTLFQWSTPADEDRADLLAFANRGIYRAKCCGLTGAQSIFHAHKAALLLWDFNVGLFETSLAVATNFVVRYASASMEQTQHQLTRLRRLEEGWKAEAAAAMDLLKESRDAEAAAGVLMMIGTGMGQLAQTHRQLGGGVDADRYWAEGKTLILAAKDVYAAAGDQLGVTNAVFGLANQLRWHGGKDEALALVKSTIPVATKYGDRLLLQKATWLQHTLETGEIPDYAAGERRIWTVAPAHKAS